MRRTRGAMLVIVMIAALLVLVIWLSTERWQNRINPTVVNQPPSTVPAGTVPQQ